MAKPVVVGAEAIAKKGWLKAHQWLILRRLSQLSMLALFLTGPCGDQAPLVERKSLQLAREVGTQIADSILSGLKGSNWRTAGPVAASAPRVRLKLRSDRSTSVEVAKLLSVTVCLCILPLMGVLLVITLHWRSKRTSDSRTWTSLLTSMLLSASITCSFLGLIGAIS